ncbi:MAG: hypothetical protein AMJ61_09430 [Desulfobacterales bacterium SG8_35_2]|nr:MAG: hypothetical protein AMJ61_09430 [Desulfobacterales bacterium SG8_35_2]
MFIRTEKLLLIFLLLHPGFFRYFYPGFTWALVKKTRKNPIALASWAVEREVGLFQIRIRPSTLWHSENPVPRICLPDRQR